MLKMVCLLTGVPSAGIVALVALLAVRGPEELVVAVLGVADLQVYILEHRGVVLPCNACGKTYRSRTALSHHKALKHRN